MSERQVPIAEQVAQGVVLGLLDLVVIVIDTALELGDIEPPEKAKITHIRDKASFICTGLRSQLPKP